MENRQSENVVFSNLRLDSKRMIFVLNDMVQKSDVYLITTLIHTIKQAY